MTTIYGFTLCSAQARIAIVFFSEGVDLDGEHFQYNLKDTLSKTVVSFMRQFSHPSKIVKDDTDSAFILAEVDCVTISPDSLRIRSK